MTSFRLRPRFRLTDSRSSEEIASQIKKKAAEPGSPCRASMVRNFIVLSIPDEHRHTWSPQLTLQLEDEPGEGTLIRGLYGPDPNIWTLFMFGYIGIATLAFFTAIYGFARLGLGMNAHILWALPGLAFLAVLLYIIAQTGQKLGVEQTFRIHHFLEESIGQSVHIR